MTSVLRLDKEAIFTIKISPAAVSASETVQQTFTVPGLQTSDLIVEVLKPTNQNGLAIGSGTVTAANTLGIVFINASGGAITPTANEAYTVVARRPDQNLPSGAAIFN